MTHPDYPPLYLDIGGERRHSGRTTTPVLDPATGRVLAERPNATPEDVADAIDRAEASFAGWAKTPAYDRAKVLKATAAMMRVNARSLARTVTLEQGKPFAEALVEAGTAADMFEWFGEEARRAYGRLIPARTASARMIVTHEPVGVVAGLAAWNVPAVTMSRKVGASLAAGCTIVYKPAEETPATALLIAQYLREAGLPEGAVSVVFGDPAAISSQIMADPVIRKVTFTGSTAIGRQLARMAADDVKRLTMELGGHAPVIICEDVDPEAVGKAAAAAKFRNAGQVCTSPTRFYVHGAVYDRFVAAFGAAAKALKVGDGLESGTQMGPCANPRRITAIAGLVKDALGHGARLVAGGSAIDKPGFYFEPTVLADVPDTAAVMSEEPFGPLAVCQPFNDVADALAKANRLPFGLASYVFTNSLTNANRLSAGVRAGNVCINTWLVSTPETPFGGVHHSGYGSEGGAEGLQQFLAVKFIHEALP